MTILWKCEVIIIKKYDVTIIENDDYCYQNVVRVEVEGFEHPRYKAIEFICKNGFLREPENQKIIEIKRVR